MASEKRKELQKDLEVMTKNYEIAVRDYQEMKRQCDELDDTRQKLELKVLELTSLIKSKDSTIENLAYSDLSKSHTIEFLCNRELKENQDIEFAAIKSYRNGWQFVFLNGKELNITPKDDVTIWADYDERVKVEIENR